MKERLYRRNSSTLFSGIPSLSVYARETGKRLLQTPGYYPIFLKIAVCPNSHQVDIGERVSRVSPVVPRPFQTSV